MAVTPVLPPAMIRLFQFPALVAVLGLTGCICEHPALLEDPKAMLSNDPKEMVLTDPKEMVGGAPDVTDTDNGSVLGGYGPWLVPFLPPTYPVQVPVPSIPPAPPAPISPEPSGLGLIGIALILVYVVVTSERRP